MVDLFTYVMSWGGLVLVIVVAVLIGMAKTGVHGAGMLSVPLLASVFGGQASSGIMLPMLVLADIMGVWYYRRHASWSHLKVLFPWAALGIVLGTLTGKYIDDKIFRIIMATTIVASLAIMIWLEKAKSKEEYVPKQKVFGITAGILGGFTSMVGNLAGTVMAVYLLAMRLPKNVYIGTTAWFFLFNNLFKVPFHVWSWHTITWHTVLLALVMLPAIIAGAYFGIILVKSLSDKVYRWFIITMTLAAAVVMLLK